VIFLQSARNNRKSANQLRIV